MSVSNQTFPMVPSFGEIFSFWAKQTQQALELHCKTVQMATIPFESAQALGRELAFAPYKFLTVGAPKAAPLKATVQPEPAAVVQPVAEVVALAQPVAPVEDSVAIGEDKPAIVETVADDLTTIKGIGPKLAQQLTDLGFETFAQVAALESADLDNIEESIPGFRARAGKGGWLKQAKALASDGKSG